MTIHDVERGRALGESGKYHPKVVVPELSNALDSSGTDAVVETGDPYADVPPPAEREEDRDSISSLLTGLLNAADLDKMTFPALTEHVPGLAVEGLTLLVGPPKVGKSWLVGDMACGCAYGGRVLGAIPVAARPVLLVSLEGQPAPPAIPAAQNHAR